MNNDCIIAVTVPAYNEELFIDGIFFSIPLSFDRIYAMNDTYKDIILKIIDDSSQKDLSIFPILYEKNFNHARLCEECSSL